MTMPNFLIIGAAKSGTSSLYEYMKQHPQIYMSPWKEPKFFALEGEDLDFRGANGSDAPVNKTAVTDRERYEALFDGVKNEDRLGEATAIYLYVQKTPYRIQHYIPEAKLIAILRNPIDRAFSSYQHLVREGWEPLTFREALAAEAQRIEENWGFLWRYVDMGLYTRQLQRYLEVFDSDQMMILLYDDLVADPVGVCQSLYGFLGVDDAFVPDVSKRYNVSGIPRSRVLHKMMHPSTTIQRRLARFIPAQMRDHVRALQAALMRKNLESRKMGADSHRFLEDRFETELVRLEELLGRDLTSWRS